MAKETTRDRSHITRWRHGQYALHQLSGLPHPSFIDSPDTEVILHPLLKSSKGEGSTSDGDLCSFHPLFSIFGAHL